MFSSPIFDWVENENEKESKKRELFLCKKWIIGENSIMRLSMGRNWSYHCAIHKPFFKSIFCYLKDLYLKQTMEHQRMYWKNFYFFYLLSILNLNQTTQTNITTYCKIKTTELVETKEPKPTMSENKAQKEVFESHLFPSTIVSDVFCSPTPHSRGWTAPA